MAILAGLALVFGPPPAPPAEAAPRQTLFDFGSDQFNSFWRHQQEVQAQPPACPPVGPCLSIPVRLSNPDGADALPVAVSPETRSDGSAAAAPEKISAIGFDLTARDVPVGAEVTMFTLSILEEGARNAEGKKIKACRVLDLWAHNETGAELWQNRPPVDDGTCVTGTRNIDESEIRWVFNLTPLARSWGLDPIENTGVMLMPEIEAGTSASDSWQITLKVPQPDKPATADVDEYEDTKFRVRVVYDFKPPPPEPEPEPEPEPPVDPGPVNPGPVDPGPVDPGPVDPGPTVAPSPTPDPEPVAEKKPAPPGAVWLLIPVGLVALAMTRSAVAEPVGEATAGRGVVAAIRRRNAEARGESGEPGSPESRFAKLLRRFRR